MKAKNICTLKDIYNTNIPTVKSTNHMGWKLTRTRMTRHKKIHQNCIMTELKIESSATNLS
jgi:broad specificity polyphosphatase/5'/3'-nucleotidase SurE